MSPDSALCVDDIMGRPVLIVEPPPDRIVAVERDRVGDAQVMHGLTYIAEVLFEGKLGRMNANYHESVLLVLLVPAAHVGQRAQAVDARVGPEVDQHDFAAQALSGQGR